LGKEERRRRGEQRATTKGGRKATKQGKQGSERMISELWEKDGTT